jgi:hypothetical protein
MGLAVNRCYITPFHSDGTRQAEDSDASFSTARGVFTLAAATYYFVLPVGCSTMFDVHLTHDAVIAITSATIETCSHAPSDVSDVSSVAGEWMDQDPTTAFVATVGANATVTNGVLAVTAGAAGGADWQVSGCPAARGRLKVVIGTPGEVRISFCGKE